MKKYSFLVAAALLFSCTFCSCGDDEEEEEEQKPNPQNQVDDQTGKVVDNGGEVNNNPSENNQGENNQGENNQGENNGGSSDVKLFDKRITSITFSNTEDGPFTTSYTYNDNGQVAKATNSAEGTFEYAYADNAITVTNTYTEEDEDGNEFTEVEKYTLKYQNGFLYAIEDNGEEGVNDETFSDLKVDGGTITFLSNSLIENEEDEIVVPCKEKYTVVIDDNCIKTLKSEQIEPADRDYAESFDFEYSDVENEFSVDIFALLMSDQIPALTTVKNRLLPSKITNYLKDGNNEQTSVHTITYEKDSDGYITKITVNTTNKYTYTNELGEKETEEESYKSEYVIAY